ncbi:MAG: hypothetical protein PQJ50_15920 [Spirochaetales bacterium]|nr:hypothetical protein [Spirochaetales bacterium]
MAEHPPEKEGINFIDRELSFTEETSELALLPPILEKGLIEKDLRSFEPGGIVELLYRMPLPDVEPEDMMLHILQSISQVSTMEGIKYWSGSRREMYPYLEEAFVVEKRKSSRQVDDPVFSSLPSEPQTYSVYQKDTTFGKAWYDVTFTVSDEAIRLSMVNSTTIRYKLFPVLRSERLHIEMVIIPGDEELLFYSMAAFKIGETFGITLRLDQSFDHRMSSLQTWFSNQTY